MTLRSIAYHGRPVVPGDYRLLTPLAEGGEQAATLILDEDDTWHLITSHHIVALPSEVSSLEADIHERAGVLTRSVQTRLEEGRADLISVIDELLRAGLYSREAYTREQTVELAA